MSDFLSLSHSLIHSLYKEVFLILQAQHKTSLAFDIAGLVVALHDALNLGMRIARKYQPVKYIGSNQRIYPDFEVAIVVVFVAQAEGQRIAYR